MKTFYRFLIAIASLCLGLSYFFPLWKIGLWAPQYPEGLAMEIWVSKLTGDIATINILNHYIGMMSIHESSFPELTYFPVVFAVLFLFGILTSVMNKRLLLYLWTVALITFSVVALYDFWSWEYRFGHELNPDAAIKMDDMVYQPPLFGEKVFLNIVATAYPGIAGWGMMVTVVTAMIISVLTFLDTLKVSGARRK